LETRVPGLLAVFVELSPPEPESAVELPPLLVLPPLELPLSVLPLLEDPPPLVVGVVVLGSPVELEPPLVVVGGVVVLGSPVELEPPLVVVGGVVVPGSPAELEPPAGAELPPESLPAPEGCESCPPFPEFPLDGVVPEIEGEKDA
jgi:hypothetical protein